MRRLVTATLSLLLSAAALYSSATPAAACTCAPVTETEEVRGVMEYYALVVEGVIAPGQGDVATEHIRFQPEIAYVGDVPGEIVLDQTWAGVLLNPDSDAYSNLGPDCSYSLIGEPGDRYVLFLQAVENGTYAPAGCASFALGEIEASPRDWLQQRYDAIKLISGGGNVVEEAPPEDVPVSPDDSGGDGPAAQPGDTPPQEETEASQAPEASPPQDEPAEGDESTPWAVVLPLALAIPLAVLFVPAFLRRRGGSQ